MKLSRQIVIAATLTATVTAAVVAHLIIQRNETYLYRKAAGESRYERKRNRRR